MPAKHEREDSVADEGRSEHDSAAEVEEVAGARSRSSTKGRASNVKDASDNGKDRETGSDEEDEEDEGEEEYEIERIIKHKMGHLQSGVYAYFVSWKGYGDEENSWVNETDAEGAKELIDEYWDARGGSAKKGRQSISATKPRRSTGRKDSEVGHDDSDVPKKATTPATKRGRASKVKSASPELVDEEMEDIEEPPKKKSKPRTSTTTTASAKKKRQVSPELDTEQDTTPVNALAENGMEDDTVYDAEKQFKKMKDWTSEIERVTTVERDSSGLLIVYFQGVDGLRYKATSPVFRTKSSGKLLDFYESNLKWRPQQPDELV
ncbi:uncharacterized protein EI90DRAFT_1403915 [Cantharellus anzutake]|uniref:uncharacterized protein n=1 Tax=Cantharellus anzutake TaxID=1750568 RepID=UPI001908DFED|nr:uncharacterized protein EI90DRAFT_1403915 [Cantharellus anzutake]KAF8329483.1 hypothetical protein EI90DRAFT_1403915 [Cantharellus anzutake]